MEDEADAVILVGDLNTRPLPYRKVIQHLLSAGYTDVRTLCFLYRSPFAPWLFLLLAPPPLFVAASLFLGLCCRQWVVAVGNLSAGLAERGTERGCPGWLLGKGNGRSRQP